MIRRYTLWEKPLRLRVVKVTADSYQWLIENSDGKIVQQGNQLAVQTPSGTQLASAGDWVGLYDNGDFGVFTLSELQSSWERRNDEEEELP